MERIYCPHCSALVEIAATCSECDNILPLRSDNLFAILDLYPQFDVDKDVLNQKLIEKLRFWHPDNFINASNVVKSIATSNSALLNYAHKQLSSHLSLASYILSLKGVDTEALASSNYKIPDKLLLEAMEWREELQDAMDINECRVLMHKLSDIQRDHLNNLNLAFKKNDIQSAVQLYVELTFVGRFIEEIKLEVEKFDGFL